MRMEVVRDISGAKGKTKLKQDWHQGLKSSWAVQLVDSY